MMESNTKGQWFISTDKSLLDIDYIFNFLTHSYWAKGRTKEVVNSSIENSLCFGLYAADVQIGFARVITDSTTFAYLADVFIDENERGKGLGKKLIAAIIEYAELQRVRRWHLLTEDAQGLYAQFGFSSLEKPEKHMEMRRMPN